VRRLPPFPFRDAGLLSPPSMRIFAPFSEMMFPFSSGCGIQSSLNDCHQAGPPLPAGGALVMAKALHVAPCVLSLIKSSFTSWRSAASRRRRSPFQFCARSLSAAPCVAFYEILRACPPSPGQKMSFFFSEREHASFFPSEEHPWKIWNLLPVHNFFSSS